MLGAKALSIIWGDTPQYWRWKSLQNLGLLFPPLIYIYLMMFSS